MAEVLTHVLSALAGGVAGWIAARRRTASSGPGVVPGLLVSDASLDWLRGMLGARAVWAVAPAVGDEPAERLESGERTLASHERAAVEHRLSEAQRGGRPAVERLDGGTLVLRPRGGAVAAALLAPPGGGSAIDLASVELDRLLDGLERRPRLASMARSELNPGQLETLEGVAHRLAFDIEALTGSDVIVAVTLPGGLTVMGLGGGADARLSGATCGPDTPLASLVEGGPPVQHTSHPPLGLRTGDRRNQERPSVLLAIEEHGRRIGGVVVQSRGGALPDRVLALAEQAVREAAFRLSRARENFELRSAAERDPLTGLANRRLLQQSMHKASLTQGALVMLDIDHFKRLNDTLGHPAGDDALLHVAGILRRETRAGDLVTRVGGEEFAVWLPGTPLRAALRLAERIRVTLEGSYWTWQGSPWQLTASFGVAHWGETTAQVDNLAAQADKALYEAKQGGRNRVVAAT